MSTKNYKDYAEFVEMIADKTTKIEAKILREHSSEEELNAIVKTIPKKAGANLFTVMKQLKSMEFHVTGANKMNEGYYGRAETEGLEKCKACGSFSVMIRDTQARSGDEPSTEISKCTDCGKTGVVNN